MKQWKSVVKVTHSSDRDEDLNKKASESMLYVLILDFQEILGTLLKDSNKVTSCREKVVVHRRYRQIKMDK